ncbi:MAG: nucleotide exchange factor GrpE [Candidatus Falkowbacteria bacterium]
MEDKTTISAVNGFFLNDRDEILLVKEKGASTWLALSGLLKTGESPKKVLENKAEKEINLSGGELSLFDAGFVDNILMIRYLVQNFSGEVALAGKYEEFIWVKLAEAKNQENLCPHVKKALHKIEDLVSGQDFENKYRRALADYQNLLKNTAQEKSDFAKYAISDLLHDIIPVYDHLKMSLSNLPTEEENSAWVTGVKYVLKQFKEALESRGVVEIKTVGEKFDHNTMEALEGQGEIVAREVMSGYMLNGRLFRAAKVAVRDK